MIVIAEGDSLTYGMDTTAGTAGLPPINQTDAPRSATPYPETLQKLLGNAYDVKNEGFPGDRTTEALSRWPDRQEAAITVIMFGTNDALNFGQKPSGPLTPTQFRDNLLKLVTRAKASGSKVVLLTPPALGFDGDAKLPPFREVTCQVARDTGSRCLDTVAMLRDVTPLWTDSVHLSPTAYRTLAWGVAEAIRAME